MLDENNSKDPFNHLKKGLKAKQLHAQMIADVGRLSETNEEEKKSRSTSQE